jgi:hypothetical protein
MLGSSLLSLEKYNIRNIERRKRGKINNEEKVYPSSYPANADIPLRDAITASPVPGWF